MTSPGLSDDLSRLVLPPVQFDGLSLEVRDVDRMAAFWGDALRAGKAKRDPGLCDLQVICGVPVAIGEDVDHLLTFVVVGAGPTGVEMAGQIAELAHRTLRRDPDVGIHSLLEANKDKFPDPPGLFTIEDLGGWEKVNADLFDIEGGAIAKIEEEAGVSTAG